MNIWLFSLLEELTIMPEILVPPLLIFVGWLFFRNYQWWQRANRLQRQIDRGGYEGALHQAIFSCEPFPFFVIDCENMNIIDANDACGNWLAREKDGLVGSRPEDLFTAGASLVESLKNRKSHLRVSPTGMPGKHQSVDLRIAYRTWLDRSLAVVVVASPPQEEEDEACSTTKGECVKRLRSLRQCPVVPWHWSITDKRPELVLGEKKHSPRGSGKEKTIRNLLRRMHRGDRHRLLRKVLETRSGTRRRFQEIFRIRNARGVWRHYLVSGKKISTGESPKAGHQTPMIGFLADVTSLERRRLTSQRNGDARRRYFEKTLFGIAIAKTKWEKEGLSKAIVREVNPAMKRFLGASEHDITGQPVSRVFPGMAEKWSPSCGKNGSRKASSSFDLSLAKGRTVRCAVFHDEKDPGCYYLSMFDISDLERKVHSEEMRKRRYRRVFDHPGVGILILDDKMIVQQANQGFATLVKESAPSRSQGMGLLEMVMPEDRDEVHRVVRSLLDGDSSRDSFEARFRAGEEDALWCHVCLSAIRGGNGEGVSLAAVVIDITESKRTQRELLDAREEAMRLAKKAEAASAAKSEFMANMSHEIRTPMNGVLGMVEILGDSELNPDQQRYLATIRNSSHSLLIILNDILDFSKIEAGELVLNEEPFDLEASVYDVATLMAHNAYRKGVELAISYPQNFPKLFLGDGARIRQILYNLIGNAVKFTPSGHVAVTVDGTLEETAKQPTASVIVSVCDTGIGIPKEDQKSIFARFQQADETIGAKFGGTGLGLAISRKLVELMGGVLELESEVDRGTVFRIRISLKPFLFKTLAVEEGPEAPCRDVLVVSRQPVFRDVIDRSLDAWGIHREHLPPDVQAINRLIDAGEDRSIDLVLLDVEPDAVQEGERLVEHVGQFSRLGIPVIVFLPLDRLEYQNRLQVPGVLDIVLKPFIDSDLREAMGDFLSPESSADSVPSDRRKKRRPLYHVRAMVVEDQEANAVVARKMLEGFGCRVDVLESGEQAIRKLSSSEDAYDLIFMDCRMPGMDGYETTKRIRYLERSGMVPAAPIIATTAFAFGGDRMRCLEAGMDDYLAKPLQFKDIGNVLMKYCKGKEIDFSELPFEPRRESSREVQLDFRFEAHPPDYRFSKGNAGDAGRSPFSGRRRRTSSLFPEESTRD